MECAGRMRASAPHAPAGADPPMPVRGLCWRHFSRGFGPPAKAAGCLVCRPLALCLSRHPSPVPAVAAMWLSYVSTAPTQRPQLGRLARAPHPRPDFQGAEKGTKKEELTSREAVQFLIRSRRLNWGAFVCCCFLFIYFFVCFHREDLTEARKPVLLLYRNVLPESSLCPTRSQELEPKAGAGRGHGDSRAAGGAEARTERIRTRRQRTRRQRQSPACGGGDGQLRPAPLCLERPVSALSNTQGLCPTASFPAPNFHPPHTVPQTEGRHVRGRRAPSSRDRLEFHVGRSPGTGLQRVGTAITVTQPGGQCLPVDPSRPAPPAPGSLRAATGAVTLYPP